VADSVSVDNRFRTRKADPMKTIRSFILAVTVLATGTTVPSSFAADKVSDDELRKEVLELRDLPPEERRVKKRELMEKVSPEQREKLRERLQNIRPGGLASGTNSPTATPEQRAARQKQVGELIAKRIADLEKKQTDGNITDQEKQQLERTKKAQEQLKNGQTPLLGQRQPDATPEQRDARMKAMREMAGKRLADLEKKKADGTLTAAEETQLGRLKAMQSRQKTGPTGAPTSK